MTTAESGQAITEYALLLVALMSVGLIAGAVMNSLYDGAFMDLLRGFGIYADNYDFVLSLPFP